MKFPPHTARWLLLPLVVALHAFAVHAQAIVRPYAPVAPQPQIYAQGPADDLSRYLNLLADNPNSVAALIGAGKAALELGDGEAALNFFGRADVLSPQDGMVKAGMASGLVMMEQAQSALPLFDEAQRLGIPVAEMGGYRGLAYDLMGDPARAQQDYRLALRRRDDAEVRRRLALSLAIAGQRDAALATIDDQLRRQDRAAWRVRAFILALTGDAQGANRVVESVMPYQAAAMAPFLARLPSLSLADRALAVHFGHFPGDPASAATQATILAQTGPVRTDPVTSAGQPDPGQRPLGQPSAFPSSPGPPPAASSLPALAGVRVAQSPTTPRANAPVPIAPAPVITAPVAPAPLPPVTGGAAAPAPVVSTAPSAESAVATTLTPTIRVNSPAPEPSIQSTLPAQTKPPAPALSPRGGLADIASVIARLSDSPTTGKPAPAKATATPAKKAERPPPPKEPSRSWVQIARSRNESGLAGEYRRIKAKAPKLFAGKLAWMADQGGTNRLLVGPFKSDKEAQAFVNQLKDEDVDAFSWTSATGQEIKKLPAK
jgi:Flp pilus assembly protein TadD